MSLAYQNDSLQNLLKLQLSNEIFDQEDEVIEFLEINSKLYSQTPADALFYVNELEEKLEAENNNTGRAYILSQKGTFYWLQGIYDAALKADFDALKLFEEANNSIESS